MKIWRAQKTPGRSYEGVSTIATEIYREKVSGGNSVKGGKCANVG